MAECKIAKSCPLYRSETNSQGAAVSNWLKNHYCRGNYAMCARHTVHEAIGQEFIPADMYPNEQARAIQIVSQADRFKGAHRRGF
jgi:hypothetical protein